MADCTNNTDPLKLVREGVSQEQRLSPALDPIYAPVNERAIEHGTVFAQAYSAFLRYYDSTNTPVDDWRSFFSKDVSVHLAIAAVQNVESYKSALKAYFDFLNSLENQSKDQDLKNNLGYLFSSLGSLAKQLDLLKDGLPPDLSLKGALHNLIGSQLAPAFKRLLSYYKADLQLPAADRVIADVHPGIMILGGATVALSKIYSNGLSPVWITDNAPDWSSYTNNIAPDPSVYGSGVTVFDRANHLAAHNLFTSIFDQFLKVYARVVGDAKLEFNKTITSYDGHEPHYALLLAFLRLFEYVRAEANTLTARHLDFYYREILKLKEKPAEPGRAHLLVELAKHVESHLLEQGELFKAGKDDRGIDAFFTNDRDFVANQAKVVALKTVYRHGDEVVKDSGSDDAGRIYASPISNSADGAGAQLTTVDRSWHPFFNKMFVDGELTEIRMPKAEIGFAVASHYLLMAEGDREVTLDLKTGGPVLPGFAGFHADVTCYFTTVKGWVEKSPEKFNWTVGDNLQLKVKIVGNDPPITPYDAKVHGYNFDTDLPLLLVKLKHTAGNYIYQLLQDLEVAQLNLAVKVIGLKTLAVSNDFGAVDASKPFQPFGATPVTGSSLIIGSKELFQKHCESVTLSLRWQVNGVAYGGSLPSSKVTFLENGVWGNSETENLFSSTDVTLTLTNINKAVMDAPDFSENSFYQTSSRNGFLRIALSGDFGHAQYLIALRNYLIGQSKPTPTGTDPTPVPKTPIAESITITYTAAQLISLNSSSVADQTIRTARFFHLAPFGQSEQHPSLNSANKVFLLPQFDCPNAESEAEIYIGVAGLKPPQNLALLFQVADGTADPLSEKTKIHWSYLRSNEWVTFANNEIEDQTGELLNSGIVTLAVPRDASDANTILPAGMHWIRAAVASESDAVCRLQMVAAQAFKATFTEKGNDPAFPAKVMPAGTISKLDQPDAAVKKIVQPFASFGGRGAEIPTAFYTRISERLRHKDRAIALWDYERLVLEAFPQIYKVKCLNHTYYGVDESGDPVYKELAPGHVTLVTVPNLQFQNLRDPLKPYTSLGVLDEIEVFIRQRLSCFVKLHVKNPEFEEVWVKFKVRLHEGFDETFYVAKLQDEITRFLSPWAFAGGGSPSFGGKIYKSVLINFVEEQRYVDYVTDFQLFHDVTGTTDLAEVEGSKAISILVSAPSKEHEITPIKPEDEATFHETCLCEA